MTTLKHGETEYHVRRLQQVRAQHMVSAGTAQSMAVLTEEDSASDSGFCGFKPASTVGAVYEFKTRVPNSGDAKLLTFPLSLARQCTAVSNSSDDSGSTIAYLPPACNGAKLLGKSGSWRGESLQSPFADYACLEFGSERGQSADERDEDSNVPLSPAPSKTLRMPPWIQPLPAPPTDICCGFFEDVGTDCRRRPPDWHTDPLQYLIDAEGFANFDAWWYSNMISDDSEDEPETGRRQKVVKRKFSPASRRGAVKSRVPVRNPRLLECARQIVADGVAAKQVSEA